MTKRAKRIQNFIYIYILEEKDQWHINTWHSVSCFCLLQIVNIVTDIVYSVLLNILWLQFTSDIWKSHFKGNIPIPLYDILQCHRTLFNHVHQYMCIYLYCYPHVWIYSCMCDDKFLWDSLYIVSNNM